MVVVHDVNLLFLPAFEHSSEGRFSFLPIRTLLFQNFLTRLLTVSDNAYKWLRLYVLSKETFTNKIIEIYSQLYYLFAKRAKQQSSWQYFPLIPLPIKPIFSNFLRFSKTLLRDWGGELCRGVTAAVWPMGNCKWGLFDITYIYLSYVILLYFVYNKKFTLTLLFSAKFPRRNTKSAKPNARTRLRWTIVFNVFVILWFKKEKIISKTDI